MGKIADPQPKNPFTYTLVIEVTKRTDNSKYSLSHDGVMLPISQLLERQKCTKIYHVAGITDIVCSLSDKALRLYTYIIHKLSYNDDQIKIPPKIYMDKNRIKDKRTYTNAVDELIRYNFIAYTGIKGTYWINPNLIFSGNRIGMYPENVIIKSSFSA